MAKNKNNQAKKKSKTKGMPTTTMNSVDSETSNQ